LSTRRRSNIEKSLRFNEQIRITPIRLIDENDGQAGVVETRDALSRAYAAGMDLVEVAPAARPPVCRIMDYGKWKYSQRKKDQKSKGHRHESELKEVRIKTPKIGDHDLVIKIQHARGFLGRGDRVQFSLRFRGRELAHLDEGHRIFGRIKQELSDCSKVDQETRFEAKRITMTLAPGAAPKKEKATASAAGAPIRPPAQARPAAPVASAPAPSVPAANAPVVNAPVASAPAPSAPPANAPAVNAPAATRQ
jgi:translation initiation factor IF-3